MSMELLIVRDPHRDVSKHRVRAFGQQGGTIGRAPECFWVLPDPRKFISTHHCAISFRDGTYWLKDISRNGVFLNHSKQPLGRGSEVPIRHGDRIRIAEYEVVVRMDHKPVAIPERRADTQRHSGTDSTGEHEALAHRDVQRATPPTDAVAEVAEAAGAAQAATEPTVAPGVTDTVLLNGNEYEHEHDGSPPLDPGAQLSSQDGDGVTGSAVSVTHAGHAAAELDPVDSAGSTHPGLPALAEPAVRPEPVLGGFMESALRRLRTARPLGAAGIDEHKFRSAGSLVNAEKPVSNRTFKSSLLDQEAMERHGILLGVADEAALRAYKILRTRLRRRLSANHWRSVGVSGASEGAGKTLTAINLAIALVQDGRTPVFLVDLDLYRPQVGAYLGLNFDKGLSDYLLGDAEIEDIIYSPGVAGLAIIPNGRPLQHSSELLASPRMAELVRFLEAEQPDHTILYDLPPTLMSDDVLVFSPLMDCVLDVVGVGVTPRASLEKSREILSELNVVGVVLNRATEQDRAGHYYYY
jgi:Mrp family chromosome partitioning ATPase